MGKARDKLEAIGEEAICDRITCGDAQSEIARDVGVDAAELCRWLHENPQRSARARSSMVDSAEAWQDRGLQALQEALPDAVEIARARAIEQHCARRAAIRNPRHSEKVRAEVSGVDGGAIETRDVTEKSPNQRAREVLSAVAQAVATLKKESDED